MVEEYQKLEYAGKTKEELQLLSLQRGVEVTTVKEELIEGLVKQDVAAMKAEPRLLVVLLIGTNNLGRGHSADETIRGVLACALRHAIQTLGARRLPHGFRQRSTTRILAVDAAGRLGGTFEQLLPCHSAALVCWPASTRQSR